MLSSLAAGALAVRSGPLRGATPATLPATLASGPAALPGSALVGRDEPGELAATAQGSGLHLPRREDLPAWQACWLRLPQPGGLRHALGRQAPEGQVRLSQMADDIDHRAEPCRWRAAMDQACGQRPAGSAR